MLFVCHPVPSDQRELEVILFPRGISFLPPPPVLFSFAPKFVLFPMGGAAFRRTKPFLLPDHGPFFLHVAQAISFCQTGTKGPIPLILHPYTKGPFRLNGVFARVIPFLLLLHPSFLVQESFFSVDARLVPPSMSFLFSSSNSGLSPLRAVFFSGTDRTA